MVLLSQPGRAGQKCGGHGLFSARVLAGHGVTPPSPALTLLRWVLIPLPRSAAPLLVTPLPTPRPWAAGGVDAPA